MGIIQINHQNVLLPKYEFPFLRLLNFYPLCSSQCVSLNQSCEVGIPASWDATLHTSLISEILTFLKDSDCGIITQQPVVRLI